MITMKLKMKKGISIGVKVYTILLVTPIIMALLETVTQILQ